MSPQPRGALSDVIQRDGRRNGHDVAPPELPTTLLTEDVRNRPDYSLGVDDAERARLLAQCALHRAEAETLLDRIGLHAGDRVLDLGCGPLGVLDLFAERVGPAGRVVGLDREARYLAIARQELDARGFTGVELMVSDATGTALDPESFDLVHERLVLNNVPRPDAVLSEMVRLTRPGGHVAVQDVDWLTWTCLPEHSGWDRLRAAAAAVWSGDVHIGRRLPALLRAAGLVDVEVIPHMRVFRPGEPYHRLLVRFVALHRERILAGRSMTAAQLDGTIAGLEAHLADPASVTLYATFFQAWGRRPE